jgi:hypothetical protein
LKKKPKEPFIPPERNQTVRQAIMSILKQQSSTARELSFYVKVSEKEIYEHLNHIRKSKDRNKFKLIVAPGSCRKCGFAFKKRERITKPGRCPLCHGELLEEPNFSIKRGK